MGQNLVQTDIHGVAGTIKRCIMDNDDDGDDDDDDDDRVEADESSSLSSSNSSPFLNFLGDGSF